MDSLKENLEKHAKFRFTPPMSKAKYEVHENIQQGNFQLAEQLIQENPAINLVADEDGRYPIHWACSMNNTGLVKTIVSKSSLDIDELVDNSGWTPIHICSSIGNEDILDILMKCEPTPDINLKTNQGTTALHLAISKKNLNVAKKLILQYKAKVNIKDKNGYTPLIRASSIGLASIVRLLNENKVNLNSTDNQGWTALHHAVAEGHGDIGKLLIEMGANDQIKSSNNELPIDVCVDDKVKKYVFE